MRSRKEMSGCPTSVARTYHRDETWDCLRVRTYGNRALEVLVSVTPHQGRREGRLQGEAAQGYALARGRARDVRMLNWSKSDSGEPRDAETVLRGSGKGGGKRLVRDLARRLFHRMATEPPYYQAARQKWPTPGKGQPMKMGQSVLLIPRRREGIRELLKAEVCAMQTTDVRLGLLRERGKRGLPLTRIYRQLFNPHLYLTAYGRIYRNKGAMTPGVTEETADSMSLEKITTIIQAVRQER